MRLGLQAPVNRVLEAERTDFLGRERYERAAEKEQRGYRNGDKPGHLHTAEGRVGIAIPQVRDTDESCQPQSLAVVRGRTEELERLGVERDARGLSTHDLAEAFRDPETGRCTISRTAVSEITDSLWEEYAAFEKRDLAGYDVGSLVLDAIDEALRRQGRTKEGLLCAWAVGGDGRTGSSAPSRGEHGARRARAGLPAPPGGPGAAGAADGHDGRGAGSSAGRGGGLPQEPAHPLRGAQDAQRPGQGAGRGAGGGSGVPGRRA